MEKNAIDRARKRLAHAEERASSAAKELKLAEEEEKSTQKKLSIAQGKAALAKKNRDFAQTNHNALMREVGHARSVYINLLSVNPNEESIGVKAIVKSEEETDVTKKQVTDRATTVITSSNSDHTDKKPLIDFLVGKLRKHSKWNEPEVKDEIQGLLFDGRIPQDLIPQPKQQRSLFMEKQGLYPRWIEDIAPLVLDVLNGKSVKTQHQVTTLQTDKQLLIDFLVGKLIAMNEKDVKDEMHSLYLDGRIPQDLIPQPKKQRSLFMEKKGPYPRWIEEVAPLVLDVLIGKSVKTEKLK